MTPILTGLLLFGIFMFFLSKGMEFGLRAATAFLPFGASAVFLVGGLSVLSFSFCFLAMLGAWSLLIILQKSYPVRLELGALIVLIICVYAIFITLIGPRLFRGEILVFSLDRSVVGYRLRHDIPSGLSPLVPTRGNISQLAYFLLTSFVFVMALSIARRSGPSVLHKAFIGAGLVNIVLAVLDIIGAGSVLSLFQTANYGYLTDIQLLGRERITGGFPEASSFGGFSAVMSAYFMQYFLNKRDALSAALGGMNFIFGLLSFSSTFILISAGIIGCFGIQFIFNLVKGRGIPRESKTLTLMVLFGLASGALLIIATPLGSFLSDFLDHLIFNKTTSLSGYERGKWALRGFEIGFESYGLGIGLGSTRSNGILSVWFSNIGFIGILLFGWFYKSLLISKRGAFEKAEDIAFFNAARYGLIAKFFAAVVTATIPDPGILFALLAALSIASRRPIVLVLDKPALRFT